MSTVSVEDQIDQPAQEQPGENVDTSAAVRPPWIRRSAARWRAVLIVCLAVVCAGLAVAAYFGMYRGDRVSRESSAAVIAAASQESVALLSYAPDTLDRDLAVARSGLTGEFLTYYSQFADQFVVPAAKEKAIHAKATVVRAAVIDVAPDTAQVLVFLNQETASRDNPTPTQAATSVKVGLRKVDGDWRISSFDPV